MKKIEILAPGGSYTGMRAAMNAGCDAVYIGGSSFGARAYAKNPDEKELLHAIDEAHIRDKKLYLTVNTLVKEKELTQRLYSFLDQYDRHGLDAVIVQDVGVMRFIHRYFPGLSIHASTQMTLTMAQGAELLKGYGVTRLVTSRELSLAEIKKIRQNTELEIETFVHGALCYCYSGQCLMSSIIGGRSGNRGRCAQPCRMPYQFYSGQNKLSTDQEKYLLSPKDINTLELIPELIDAGIDSFKIEGRMKRPEYGAVVAALYRKYVDYYLEHGREHYLALLSGEEFEQDMTELQDIYNRGGFSRGYGADYHGKSMMSMQRPNHSGVLVGRVSAVQSSRVMMQLVKAVNPQDILEIRDGEGQDYEFTVKAAHPAGSSLETNVGIRRGQAQGEGKSFPSLHTGAMVYRTKNNVLLESVAKKYLEQDKKLGIHGILSARLGKELTLTASYGDFSVTVWQGIVQEAKKQPMTGDKLTAPLQKTGDTLFYFEELELECDESIFVPVAWLNEIRREALERLSEKIAGAYRRDRSQQGNSLAMDEIFGKPELGNAESEEASAKENAGYAVIRDTLPLAAAVSTAGQYEAAVKIAEITKLYVEYDRLQKGELAGMSQSAKALGKKLYLSLPHICRLSVYTELEKELSEIIDSNWIDGFLIKNLEEVSLLHSLLLNDKKSYELILNQNMYVYNQEAKSFYRENGITRFTAPAELNQQELKQLDIRDCEIVVYGHLPLMVSAQCLLCNISGCRKNSQGNAGYLTDRLGKKFLVRTNCRGCYNVIYNGQALALHKQYAEIIGMKPSGIRLDFTTETPAMTQQIIACFVDTFCHGKKAADAQISDYTTGHFKRGVE